MSKKRLTTEQIKDLAFEKGLAWGDKLHSTVSRWNEFIIVDSRAVSPRNPSAQYRAYLNEQGEQVAYGDGRHQNWYNTERPRRKAFILKKGNEEYARIKLFLQSTDPSIKETRISPEAV
jgi:hypothetical protein